MNINVRPIEQIYEAYYKHQKLNADEKLCMQIDSVICMDIENVVYDDYADRPVETSLNKFIEIIVSDVMNTHISGCSIANNKCNRFKGKSKINAIAEMLVKKEIKTLIAEGYKFSNISDKDLEC